jgi:hypothetical protein
MLALAGCGGKSGSAKVVLESGKVYVGSEIPAPLKAGIDARKSGQLVLFSLSCTDAKGEPVRQILLPGDEQPDPPEVKVVDQAGKAVYTCTLEYG